jgi:hypothetical protein
MLQIWREASGFELKGGVIRVEDTPSLPLGWPGRLFDSRHLGTIRRLESVDTSIKCQAHKPTTSAVGDWVASDSCGLNFARPERKRLATANS